MMMRCNTQLADDAKTSARKEKQDALKQTRNKENKQDGDRKANSTFIRVVLCRPRECVPTHCRACAHVNHRPRTQLSITKENTAHTDRIAAVAGPAHALAIACSVALC